MKNHTRKLLRLLEKSAGKKVSRGEITRELTSRPKKNFKNKKRKSPGPIAEDPTLTLAELESLGMVSAAGRKLIPKKPFTAIGRVSLNQKGFAFISVLGASRETREIFIYPENTRGAMTGDICRMGSDFVSDQAFTHVFRIGQTQVLLGSHVAEHRSAMPTGHGRTDG